MNRATFTALTGAIAGMLATRSFAAESPESHATPHGAQRIAMLVYPGMTALDMVAPQLIFAALGNTDVQLVWKDRKTVLSDTGVPIVPTQTFDEVAPGLTVLFAPGSSYPVMNDPKVVAFMQRVGPSAEYVTSVCTGALILGAAGLLRGYRATTHWVFHDVLATLGATPVAERVVVDRNRITGAGVTAGLDFGLRMAAKLRGDDYARMLQLIFEYDPQPPFDAGSKAKAGEKIGRKVRTIFAPALASAKKEAAIARERLTL
ncbi:MAG TPA: DJ-1/PfpI family protein [Candidatus Baltobacteraceae bacterium]|nr:DJ-1/PfpI family protein [Candidatus Baltobacteraceae bacterium]